MSHDGTAHTRGIDAVLQQLDSGAYDFQLADDGDILTDDAFDSAIIVSLFTDKRADVSEVQVSEHRRGWIGNESTPDFEIGSKLWLYEQSRLTQNVLNGVVDAAQSCLQWFVTDSIPATDTTIANAVRASASVSGGTLRLLIEIDRPSSEVEKRYFDLWDQTGKNPASALGA